MQMLRRRGQKDEENWDKRVGKLRKRMSGAAPPLDSCDYCTERAEVILKMSILYPHTIGLEGKTGSSVCSQQGFPVWHKVKSKWSSSWAARNPKLSSQYLLWAPSNFCSQRAASPWHQPQAPGYCSISSLCPFLLCRRRPQLLPVLGQVLVCGGAQQA